MNDLCILSIFVNIFCQDWYDSSSLYKNISLVNKITKNDSSLSWLHHEPLILSHNLLISFIDHHRTHRLYHILPLLLFLFQLHRHSIMLQFRVWILVFQSMAQGIIDLPSYLLNFLLEICFLLLLAVLVRVVDLLVGYWEFVGGWGCLEVFEWDAVLVGVFQLCVEVFHQ